MKTSSVVDRIVKNVVQRGSTAALDVIGSQLRRAILPKQIQSMASWLLQTLTNQGEDAGDGSQKGAAIINISIAIAVGAPGKNDSEEPNDKRSSPPGHKDAVVVATAVTGDPESNTGSVALTPALATPRAKKPTKPGGGARKARTVAAKRVRAPKR